jgi:hypothetical protein
MRKEAVVAKFKVLSWNLRWRTDYNDDKLTVAGVRSEVWTPALRNANQESQPLDHDFRFSYIDDD